MVTPDAFQLTYCTNIHPSHGWDEVLATLRRCAPELKRRLSPDFPFAIGLRLSSDESVDLLRGDALRRFKDFLDDEGLYVFTLNGFPYGSFHQRTVKAGVFAPDWRREERVQYTLRLIKILRVLLPEGMTGGISTVPISYKPWFRIDEPSASVEATRNLLRVVAVLHRLREAEGRFIHLDLEPEPDGVLEESAEVVRFFEDELLPTAALSGTSPLGLPREQARRAVLDHVQVCFDACHMAVAYDPPAAALDRLEKAGIGVGKVQLSSALKVPLSPDPEQRAAIARQLEPYAESTWLHQVIERREGGTLRHLGDLTGALPRIKDPEALEWRIHFHVPLFADDFGAFGSTREELRATLDQLVRRRCTDQLEIETYTWQVLPPALRCDVVDSIEREYRWVLETLAANRTGGRHA